MKYFAQFLKISLFLIVSISFFKAQAADFFWVNGTGNWSDFTNHWRTTNNSPWNRLPTDTDNVIFNAASFTAASQIVTVDVAFATCKTMNWTSVVNNPTFTKSIANDTLQISGSLIFSAGFTNSYTGNIVFNTTQTDSIKTNGISFANDVWFRQIGELQLKSVCVINGILHIERGTFKSNNFNITAQNFDLNYPNFRDIQLGTSTINITAGKKSWIVEPTNLALETNAATFTFSYTGIDTILFQSGGQAYNYNVVNIPNNIFNILSTSTFTTLNIASGATVIIEGGTTQSFTTLNATGTCGNPIVIFSNNTTQVNISSTANVSVTYWYLKGLKGTGVGTFTANNSVDEGNNTNFTITAPTGPANLYWIGNNGNWYDGSKWSNTSGGAAANCVPSINTNVFFDANSFSGSGQTVTVDYNAFCNNITWTGSNAPNFSGNFDINIKGSMVLNATMNLPLTGNYLFYGVGAISINTFNRSLNGKVILNNATGNYSLASAFTSLESIDLQNGTFNTANFNITTKAVLCDIDTNIRTLSIGNSSIILNGSGDVWKMAKNNFTFNTGATSRITCASTLPDKSIFTGADKNYIDLFIQTSTVEVLDSNTFKHVFIQPGSKISIESEKAITLDSLTAIGTCATPIIISATEALGLPATIRKTGNKNLLVSFTYISNVIGDIANTQTYTANNSILQYTTTNWTATAPAGTGDTYYWIGRTGNWNNVSNWSLTSGGVAAGCLPTILDTVVFDANSFNGPNQVVSINVDAYCNLMTWATATNNPRINFLQTLTIRRNLLMNAAMTTSGSRDGVIRFLPLGNNCGLNTQNVTLNASVLLEGSALTDQLQLQNNVTTDDSLNAITIIQGTFITNNRAINTGSINLITGQNKQVTLGSSIITLRYGWNALGITSGLTITAGTSQITINGDRTGEFFNGAGQTYYDVTIFSGGDNATNITASNTFRRLTINPGVDAKFEAGTTQTTQRFRALGFCTDSISLFSSISGSQATITQNGDSIWAEAAFVKDMVAAGTATKGARFSSNGGNNTGWTFPTQAAATANFTYPALLCRGTAINFTNTSTAANGNINSLDFKWQFGDGDTSDLLNPTHTYSQGGKKGVTLIASYTNGCKNSKTDSITVNDLQVQIESSSPSGVICAGDTVTFRTLDNATTYQFFRNNIAIAPASVDTFVTINNLANNDSVYVIASQGGCNFRSTAALKFVVNPLPTPTLTSSDANSIICDGDRVKFTGTNANEFLFYLNGNPTGFFANIDSFVTSTLANGDVIRMEGKNTVTGCFAFAPQTFTFTVNPIPNAVLTSSDIDNVICAGESVTFTASGGTDYQYTINNVAQGAFTASNTFTSTTIQQSNTVRVIARANGCTKVSNGFTFTVNPLPNVTLTNDAISNTLCVGDDITFTANGATAYEFFVNGTSVQAAQVNPIFNSSTLNNGDIVTVEGQTNGCKNTSTPNNMVVNNVPIVSLVSSDADNIICLNESVTFTAGGATTYEFFIGAASQGVPSANNTFTTTNILNGQEVTVVGYQNGCSATANNSFTFTVKQIPLVNIFSSDFDNIITRCEEVTFTSLGATTYEFFINGVSQGVASNVNTLVTSTLQNNQQIYVRGVANSCPAFSDTLVFTVNNPPQPAININTATTICTGTNVVFATNNADEYEFYLNGTLVQGRNTQTTYSNASLNNGDKVYVLGYVFDCPTSSDTLTFVVNQFPTVTLTSSDADNSICRNESVTFTASGATNYEFFVNGVSQGVSSVVNTFTTSSILNNQNVRVRGTANGCSANSSNILFTVIPQPNISLFSSDLDNSICQGDAVTFTALGGVQYEFFVNGTSQGAASNVNTFSTSSLPAGNPEVSVLGFQGGCFSSAQDTFTMQVTALPTVSLISSDADNIICEDDTVTFTASGASQYRFFINNIAQGAFSANNTFIAPNLTQGQTVRASGSLNGCFAPATPTYTFTVNANPNTTLTSSDIDRVICDGDAVTLTATGASIYEFFIDGISQGAASTINQINTSSLVDSNRIQVVGTSNGCTAASGSLLFRVNDLPTVNLLSSDADNTICAGDNITFTASGASLYEFMVNGNPISNPSATSVRNLTTLTNGQTVSLNGINQFGCEAMAAQTFTITVNALPTVTLASSDANNQICTNEVVTFTAGGAQQYQFYIGNNIATTLSNNNIYTTDSIQNAQIIKVVGVSNGCSAFAAATYTHLVNVFPLVGLTSSATSNTICENDTITFKASGANQYEFFVDNISLGAPSAIDSFVTNSLTNNQVVTVKGYNVSCISQSPNTYSYSVTPLPVVGVSSSDADNRICYGTPVTFTSNGATSYEYFINNLSQGITNNNTYINDEIENGNVISVKGYTNGCGNFSSNNFSFIVDKLNINLTSSTNTGLVCSDAPITFTATGANAYEFFVDGVSQGASSPNNTVTFNGLSNGSIVTVEGFSNITNCTQLADASFTLNVLPEILLTPANDTSICEGDTLLLISNYEKGNQWFKNSNLIAGETKNTLAVTESGTYNLAGFKGGNGNIWTIGRNTFGQIGDSSINSVDETYLIPEFENINSLEAGLNFNIVSNASGRVWAWGSNNFGQLGDGTFADETAPKRIAALSNIVSVAAGDEFALALTNAGKVWTWGKNDKGQLGQGNTSTQQFPFEIGSLLNNAILIAAGGQHSLAIKADSTVVAWGDNQYGQLGNGNFTNRFFPTAILNFNGIVAIAAGTNHSLAVKADGTVWVWGNNANGQLGRSNINFSNTPIQVLGINNAVKAVGGEEHTLILTADGRVYAFGGNDYGQLGDSSLTQSFSPKKIKNLKSVKNIFAGAFNSFAIKTDGSVYSWGINTDYQLANGNNQLQTQAQYASELLGSSIIGAGLYHTAVVANDKVSCSPNPILVTVNPIPNAVVEWAQDGIKTNSAGVSFQWYYNGIAIPTGTEAFLPTQTNGNYQVAVTNAEGCTTLSEVFSFTVGIENLKQNPFLLIYPNPSNDIVYLKFSNALVDKITVVNVLGEIINETVINTDETILDVSNFASGIYFIHSQIDGQPFINKFIVSK